MRIVAGSGGSFLCPPGHPMLTHHLEDGTERNPNLIAGLDYALANEYGDVPPTIRAKVTRMYADATLIRSELWEAHVYGYFRNCYAPESGTRNVSECIIPKRGDPVPPPERHLAFLAVREYFPDAEPRLDLIANGGDYGSSTCAKCGTTIQYESSVDAYATPITAGTVCPEGGTHERGTA